MTGRTTGSGNLTGAATNTITVATGDTSTARPIQEGCRLGSLVLDFGATDPGSTVFWLSHDAAGDYPLSDVETVSPTGRVLPAATTHYSLVRSLGDLPFRRHPNGTSGTLYAQVRPANSVTGARAEIVWED
jgi:hypothetical protein